MEKGYALVFSKNSLSLKKLLKYLDKITITTYIVRVKKFFALPLF